MKKIKGGRKEKEGEKKSEKRKKGRKEEIRYKSKIKYCKTTTSVAMAIGFASFVSSFTNTSALLRNSLFA